MDIRKTSQTARPRQPAAASLIELLVVLFIMGIMMSLLLPALQRARGKADEMVCENNLYQLKFGLAHFMDAKRRFPSQNEWTIDILAYIEQRPLADIMKQGFPADAKFPRPPLMQCPFQANFDSRVPGVDVCHYVLTVDRSERGLPLMEKGWTISDRPYLDESEPHAPWYVSPEATHDAYEAMLETEEGPHPDGFHNVYGQFPK